MGFSLGKYEMKHGLCLAPMAGYTDRAMRLVCHEAGAEYSVTEMVSAKAVVITTRKPFHLRRFSLTRALLRYRFSAQSLKLWQRRQTPLLNPPKAPGLLR